MNREGFGRKPPLCKQALLWPLLGVAEVKHMKE
jgi:hypothetical protein